MSVIKRTIRQIDMEIQSTNRYIERNLGCMKNLLEEVERYRKEISELETMLVTLKAMLTTD